MLALHVRFVVGPLAVLLMALIAAAAPGQSYGELQEQAAARFAAKDYPEGLALVERAIAKDANRWEAHYLRAELLMMLDRPRDANDSARHALDMLTEYEAQVQALLAMINSRGGVMPAAFPKDDTAGMAQRKLMATEKGTRAEKNVVLFQEARAANDKELADRLWAQITKDTEDLEALGEAEMAIGILSQLARSGDREARDMSQRKLLALGMKLAEAGDEAALRVAEELDRAEAARIYRQMLASSNREAVEKARQLLEPMLRAAMATLRQNKPAIDAAIAAGDLTKALDLSGPDFEVLDDPRYKAAKEGKDSGEKGPALAALTSAMVLQEVEVTATTKPAANAPRVGERFSTTVDMSMIYVQPGTFVMGASRTDRPGRFDQPQHQVAIAKGFWLAEGRVTPKQWFDVMREWRHFRMDADGENAEVSWTNATGFCAVLTNVERAAGRVPDGYQYMLPTEAEWELACRAGTTTAFCFGDEHAMLESFVRARKPNAWGFVGMHDPVWEWCLDGADPLGAVDTPSGDMAAMVLKDPLSRFRPNYVLRGNGRSAGRNHGSANMPMPRVGFRPALVLRQQ